MEVRSGITERDLEMLKFINFFGKSYLEVLAKCFFPTASSSQVCRNRLNVLKNKYKLIKFIETGALSPRSYVALSDMGKRFLEDELQIIPNNTYFSFATMQHNMYEQLVAFGLMKAGKEVQRTKVLEWSKGHHHTPDLIYYNGDKLVYVEIELTKKTRETYDNIFKKIIQDGVSNVIYIAKDEKWKKIFLEFLPSFDGLRVADFDSFFENCVEKNKVTGDKK
ncbi:hypothetical protein N5T78_10350 [Aliarcobacter cryaerophilus]|uniref:hypothetical protein n=1 Tax=Aliarcobacter cryaerophilus TaxID=28198 RepID=UPI0021B5B1D2|nr:hypothetical protein [Aliarcobacter cryaerophilus]MCT7466982.1 hypothetical protein [Aliarcobacter cryaerophilus]